MSKSSLSGKLFATTGGLKGSRVRVKDAATGKVLREAVTGDDGYFNIRFDSSADHLLIKDTKKIIVEAVDHRGKIFSKKTYAHNLATDKKVDLKIPGNIAGKVKPEFPSLKKISGSILDLSKMNTFWTAMSMAYPTSMPARMSFGPGSICPLPDIKHVPDIVDVAWDVLGGDPMAKIRMRETLNMLKPTGENPNPNIFYQMSEKGFDEPGLSGNVNTISSTQPDPGLQPVSMMHMSMLSTGTGIASMTGRSFLPTDRPCFLTKDRFLPVAAAAMMSARSRPEMFMHLGHLEAGLCGLGRMNGMLEAATTVVQGGNMGRFRGMVGMRWGECGPDDGPLPGPFPDPEPEPCPPWPSEPGIDWCLHERLDCIRELIAYMQTLGSSSSTPYAITDISPAGGCPGITITITGTNFGSDGGKVRFTATSGGTVLVNPITWSDTQITAQVPVNAGTGIVSLKIVERTDVVCQTVFTTYKTGTGHNFNADTAVVSSLSVNGEHRNIIAEPGQTLTIAWGASHDDVHLRILRDDGLLLHQHFGLPATGSRNDFSVPGFDTERTIAIEATVTSPCGAHTLSKNVFITVRPELTIEGMEFTQGVQRYWRPGVTWNSIPTIAGKDTIVRVYVSCDRNGFESDEQEVTGILHIDGNPHYPINGSSPEPTADSPDPFIIARDKDLIDRTNTNHTLNFRIPASRCNGTKNVRVRVFTEPITGASVSETLTVSRTWTVNSVLKLRFVRVRDDSQSPATARPTEDQCRYSVERAVDLMPTTPTDIGPAWRPTWNTDEDFTNDDDDLRDLLSDIDDEHNCNAWEWLWGWTGATDCPDADNAIWVGYSLNFNRGMGYRPGNTCISAVYSLGQGQTNMLRIKTAHEVGHNLDMKHIDVGGAGDPFYDHPNSGNLQDVPFDPYWNVAISGVTDFMGYGSPRWSSADSWGRMIDFI